MSHPSDSDKTLWPASPHLGGTPPAVWRWYLAYSISLAAVYLLLAIAGVVLFVLTQNGSIPFDDPPFIFAIYTCVGLPLGVAFGITPFLPKRKWAWIYHLVAICIGLTSICCMPASIPLLIFWIKPETKAFFNA